MPRRRLRSTLAEFLGTESAGGAVLLAGAVAALVWANGPWRASYADWWGTHLRIGPVDESLRHWVNDALMTVFFFVAGLEIKRELVTGELRDRRAAALPVIAAAGGMVVPALVYLALAGGDARRGWGIPMATDIAFALGVLTLLGSRVPASARLFLLTLAIVDDIGAIVVIALFYTDDLAPAWLAVAAAAAAAAVALRRIGAANPLVYAAPAAVLWYALFESGVHATLAGVVLGLLTPALPVRGRDVLAGLEHRLHPVSSFAVVPLFALANAGVEIGGGALAGAAGSPVGRGVFAGLVAGKLAGITLATLAAARAGAGRLPAGLAKRHVVGLAALAGIGFTVSIFVADLSFAGPRLAEAKLAILAASLTAGALGASLLSRSARARGAAPRARGPSTLGGSSDPTGHSTP